MFDMSQGRNIAGDPRYFAPSAWMQLTHGYRYLENNPKVYWQRAGPWEAQPSWI